MVNVGADEVGEVEVRVGDVLAFVGHPVGQAARLLVAPVGADQVGVVDIGVIDVLARLHLGLQLLDDVAFADQVVRDLDAGDGGERRRQHLRFVLMRGDGFGHDLDVHAGKGLAASTNHCISASWSARVERRQVADLGVEEGLRRRPFGRGGAATPLSAMAIVVLVRRIRVPPLKQFLCHPGRRAAGSDFPL